MKTALLLLASVSLAFGACTADSRGVVITGATAPQDQLLGPLTCFGTNPWIFGDLAEQGVVDNMAPAAIGEAPALGTALSGTFSWNQGDQFFTTSVDQTTPLAGVSWIAVTWTTVDGAGTGRMLCPISSVTSTRVNCADGDFNEPTSSGATAYLLPPPDSHGLDFQSWTTENPSTVWNYYDVAIALYRLHYRIGSSDTTYLGYARSYADITWQWTLDHGYRSVAPRASTLLSQFFRALDGHPERLPGLYNWMTFEVPKWANVAGASVGNVDVRESGYVLWGVAIGAKTDPDPTRHAQYCSWLTTYTPTWNSVQNPDGSFGEKLYGALGGGLGYVSAPKSFVPPFVWPGSPWRVFAAIKGLEAAYEALNSTDPTYGCSQTALAAATLTTITNAVTWQRNYGRDSVNRGAYYEVNSQSQDQNTVYHPGGTVSINLSSTALTGVGTGWVTAGYCDGTHFIGLETTTTIYKIAWCANDTHATLANAFGLYGAPYGETANLSGSQYSVAPAATTSCNSSASQCFGSAGDRSLTRTIAGDTAWLYAHTSNPTYLAWADEWTSATLGGPTAGLTTAVNVGTITLPCSGLGCDGFVNDMIASAPSCYLVGPPCAYGVYGVYANLGKNFAESWGAPGIDNALAWRLPAFSVVGSAFLGALGGNGTIQ